MLLHQFWGFFLVRQWNFDGHQVHIGIKFKRIAFGNWFRFLFAFIEFRKLIWWLKHFHNDQAFKCNEMVNEKWRSQ